MPVSGSTSVLAWTRSKGSETVLFVANFSADPATGLTVQADGAPTLLLAEGVAFRGDRVDLAVYGWP